MLVFFFQDADRDIGACAGVGVNRSTFGVWHLEGGILKVFLDTTLKLPDGEHGLHEAGSAHRVTTGDKPAGGVHRADRLIG